MQIQLLFRERLRKENVIDELFEMFESYLGNQGKSPTRWIERKPKALAAKGSGCALG